tara:strand:- start:195 stop:488 length:294 start_codon:yes stop_codon:yes gene_type:complete
MILIKSMIAQFLDFASSSFGSKVILHPEIQSGEIARFMCRNKFFVVREFEDSNPTTTVEVWCSHAPTLEEVENTWTAMLTLDMEEFDFKEGDQIDEL